MQIFETRTIGEIALASPAAARVFEEFKLDYCCNGQISFSDACKSAGIEPAAIETRLIELMEVDAKSDLEAIGGLTLGELVRYIVEKHHSYTKKELEHLRDLAGKVLDAHGERHPELSDVKDTFDVIRDDLMPHMLKEEIVLFPYISDLESNLKNGIVSRKPHFGSISNPVGMMAIEHERIADLLTKMRSAAGNYRIPSDACPNYASFYSRLSELERDLHQHIHLENNLLFIKAVALDEEADRLSN